ncbi:MAG: creatininase family protein [Candidatus Obscuribacterales bacterium]|nr:creatininase family protein [Candidatus Obscuribacterales bacterium]
MPGKILECLTWKEAEAVLKEETLIVIPLGAAAKEHGYHLQLRNDWLIAEYLKTRLIIEEDLLALPTLNYSYYPAFVEYPGSISLSKETARNMIIEICRSIAAFGPKRFYVLNTGISTLEILEQAALNLLEEKIVLHYTNMDKALADLKKEISEQEGGSHADEIETSMLLYIAPESVQMQNAKRDYIKDAPGRLSRRPDTPFSYSESGVWGDATLASRSKGEKIVECLFKQILEEIEALRKVPVLKD